MTKSIRVDIGKLSPLHLMKGDDEQDSSLLVEMAKDAYVYLLSFSWCSEVTEQYFGIGVGGVVAVFLFRIKPAIAGVDEWLWVIVGDLPPAYLVTDNAPNPAGALCAYIELMEDWVEAVQGGKPIDDLIPVNVEPNPANAQLLQKRLEFLKTNILIYYLKDIADN